MNHSPRECGWKRFDQDQQSPYLSDTEALDELVALITAALRSEGLESDVADRFRDAILEPPVTRKSLEELDISSILNNTNLRHIINFDMELHFRPNVEGPKGQVKREQQRGYWKAVVGELVLFKVVYSMRRSELTERGLCLVRHRNVIQRRLRLMFETIKDIIMHLVPKDDQQAVMHGIDVPMLMQEMERNACDFVSIVEGIALLLKRHCAPIRDEMVDRMVDKIRRCNAASVSAGLCDLFAILEAMKLDVANHQIRYLRGPLIEDTVNFQQKYHMKRIEQQKTDPHRAWSWYRRHQDDLEQERNAELSSNDELRVFVTAIVRHLLPTCVLSFPDTFSLDMRRLRGLKAELQDIHFLNICIDVFGQLVREILPARALPQSTLDELERGLEVWNIPGELSTPTNIANVIAEIVRHTLRACGIHANGYNAVLEQRVEQRLFAALSDPAVVVHHAKKLESDLSSSVLDLIRTGKYLNASPFDVFSALVLASTAAVPASAFRSQRTVSGAERLASISRRVGHIAVLHWRIWAPLVYLNDEYDPNTVVLGKQNQSPSPAATVEHQQTRAEDSRELQLQDMPAEASDRNFVPATTGEERPVARGDQIFEYPAAEPRTLSRASALRSSSTPCLCPKRQPAERRLPPLHDRTSTRSPTQRLAQRRRYPREHQPKPSSVSKPYKTRQLNLRLNLPRNLLLVLKSAVLHPFALCHSSLADASGGTPHLLHLTSSPAKPQLTLLLNVRSATQLSTSVPTPVSSFLSFAFAFAAHPHPRLLRLSQLHVELTSSTTMDEEVP